MKVVRWLVGAILFIALLFLSLDNAETVTLRLFRIAQWQAPLVFVLFLAFAIGVALGLLAGAMRASRLRRQLRHAREGRRSAAAAPGPHGAPPQPPRKDLVPPEIY